MNVFRLCKILNRKRINKEEMRYNAIKVRDDNKNKYESKYFDYKINSSQNDNNISQHNNTINQYDNIINQYNNNNYNYNYNIKINNNLVYSKSGILQNNNDSFIRHPEIFLTMKKTRSCKKYLQNYRFLEDVVEQRRLVQNGFKTKIDKQQNINKYSFNINNSNFNYQKMSNDFNDEFVTSKNYKQYDNFSKNCRKDVYGMPIDQFSFKQIQIQDLYTKIIKSITENITFLIMFNFLETKDYSGLLFRSLENVLPIYLISGYIYLCRYLKYKMNSLRDLSKIFFICCWISAKTTYDKHVPFDEMFINTDICTKDISYIEAHILFKINYDIEIYQEEVLRYIW